MSWKRGSLMIVGCLFLVGCAGTTGALDAERRLTAVEGQNIRTEVRDAILDGRVFVGMSDAMVAASWGLPRHVYVATAGTKETWVYGERLTPGWETRLIFDDGTLIDMERSRVQGVVDSWWDQTDAGRTERHVLTRLDRDLNH